MAVTSIWGALRRRTYGMEHSGALAVVFCVRKKKRKKRNPTEQKKKKICGKIAKF